MGKDAALVAVRQFRDALAKRGVHQARLVIFGFHVSGRATDDSDIDVVVISDDFTGRGLWERINMMAPAIRETKAPIEATALTSDEWKNRSSVVVEYAANGIEM